MAPQTVSNSDSHPVSIRLGAERLCKRYGAVEANRDISLNIAPNEIHAIVGENGAGKSTLMRMLQGLEQPDSGHIIVDDLPLGFAGPQQAFAHGIGMVHQEFMLAPNLTLLENLVLGDEPVLRTLGIVNRIDWEDALRSGNALASQAGVQIDWSRTAGQTPVHLQQFVEIIRLLRRGTRVLIMDEPTAVLAPQQVDDLFVLLRNLRENGTTILFISHKLKEVMALADKVTVLRRGKVTYSSDVADTNMEEIARHMVGGEDVDTAMIRPSSRTLSSGPTVFETIALSTPALHRSHPLFDINLSIGAGEIVGLAGVSGNGQNELVECLVGLRSVGSGKILLNGEDISNLSNQHRRETGMGYISADRRQEGLALDSSIEANVVVGSQRRVPVSNGNIIDLTAMRRMAVQRLNSLHVQYGSVHHAVRSLSGGNQQRLVFARETATHPSVLIVSQPTRGVDLKGIAAIHEILRDIRSSGGSLLLVSEELDEILALSDRIYVIAEGRVVGELPAEQADHTTLGQMMTIGLR